MARVQQYFKLSKCARFGNWSLSNINKICLNMIKFIKICIQDLNKKREMIFSI